MDPCDDAKSTVIPEKHFFCCNDEGWDNDADFDDCQTGVCDCLSMHLLYDATFDQASAIGDLDLDLLSAHLSCGNNYGCSNGNSLGIGESDVLGIGEGDGVDCDSDNFCCGAVGNAIAITIEYDNINVTNQYLFRYTNIYSQINASTWS